MRGPRAAASRVGTLAAGRTSEMRGGSSERLVVRAGRSGGRGGRRRGEARARLTRYITVLLAALLGGGGSALLFLVPLYADPALSALAADFDPAPADCVTERRDDRLGLDNCTWASCREGCTSDAYRCTQLHVKYRPAGGEWRPAVLFVNIKGCGYPPAVDCANFTLNFGSVGARYPCYWSRAERGVVVPSWSRGEQVATVTRTLAIPLFISGCAGIGLCALHCECRPRRRRPPRRPPRLPAPVLDDSAVYRLA
ncbi:protein tipE [Aricia agestis]|uniref:protein tipE n=1 Tax=Aricia agestis TaxID=91739 RepID=UPI001C2057AB|nr:protein tipE [Aricia agestis]